MLNLFTSKTSDATTAVEGYVYEDDKELQNVKTSWFNTLPGVAAVSVAAGAAVGLVVLAVKSGASDVIES